MTSPCMLLAACLLEALAGIAQGSPVALAACYGATSLGAAQTQPAVLIEEQDAYKAELERRADGKVSTAKPRRVLRPVLSGLDRPASPGEFKAVWHNPLVCQDLTGQCWAFGATSLLESEVQRATGRKVKLSEAWTFYWEFVEKARGFVRAQGKCEFPRGSEPNAALRVWREHGVVPAEAYTGRPPGRDYYDDRKLYAELKEYLTGLARRFSGGEANSPDEAAVITHVRSILDRHMGPPPKTVKAGGALVSPREYFARTLGMNTDRFVCIMSTMAAPPHQYGQLEVPDNWWGSREYYNLPLEDYVRAIRETVRRGGTVCLGIDITEPGFYFREDVAIVPSFDIPSKLIDGGARQMRFVNESTTDDHIVHVVGIRELGEQDAGPTPSWYLVKDSDTRPRNGHHRGYMFYDEDYIRLKSLFAMLPRNLLEQALHRRIAPAAESKPGN